MTTDDPFRRKYIATQAGVRAPARHRTGHTLMTLAQTHTRCHNENGPGGAGHTHRDPTHHLTRTGSRSRLMVANRRHARQVRR